MLAGILDYDDVDRVPFMHPSRSVVPPAFAVAENMGGINGQDLIAAVALGYNLVSRIADAAALKAGVGGLEMPGFFAVAIPMGRFFRR